MDAQMRREKRETRCIKPKNQKLTDFSLGARNIFENTKICEFLHLHPHKMPQNKVEKKYCEGSGLKNILFSQFKTNCDPKNAKQQPKACVFK